MDKENDDFNKKNEQVNLDEKNNNREEINDVNKIEDEKIKTDKENIGNIQGVNEIQEIIEDSKQSLKSNNTNKDEKDKNEEINSKNKKIKIIGITIAVFLIIAILVNATVSKYDSVVYPGVRMYGEDISLLNKNDLTIKVKDIKDKINKNEINILVNNNNYKLKMKDITINYNEDKLINDILNKDKYKNILQKYSVIITKQQKDYVFDIELDKDLLNEKIKKIEKENNIISKEPKVIIDGERIKIEDGKKGSKLDDKSLLKDLEKRMSSNDIYKEKININSKYIDDNPKIDKNELNEVNYKISTYTTTYSPGGGRGTNVAIAAKKIDDMLLMPGDEFSYEKSVGPVIQSNGYTYAPVISNGELVQGIGGGVCQVSSTLYNTQLKAGILPTERRNHSKAVSYVPRGLDATLASGSIDYKFKNTHEYPIVINTSTVGGKLTIEFWSNKDALKGIEYKPVGYASGKTANTYLYGYDKEGKKVYEKHIDTSVYR